MPVDEGRGENSARAFRKRPVEVRAERFLPDPRDVGWPRRWPEGVVEDTHSATGYAIDTLEGRALEVAPGDWIITGVKGERYPCKPDVFEATYEPVEDTE